MNMIVSGKVWKMGDHIYRITWPGVARKMPWEEEKNNLHTTRSFARVFRRRFIVQKKFGCGPSRKTRRRI